MEDGMLTGILGGEEEKVEAAEVESALSSVEAFAAAVVAIASRQDPAVARKTEAFLEAQTRLLTIQSAHLKDEHALRMSGLSRRTKEDSLRLASSRLRVAFQLLTAVVGVALAAGAALFLRDAAGSHQVVIEPFHTPPSLAARGVDGAVVASGLLDELTHLQHATRSNATALSTSNAWAGDIKVEVLGTGISIGEVSRMVRERFGHDVHIEGDLVATDAGKLALTVRGNGIEPKAFAGEPGEFDKLTVQAAEYVYAQSQPVRWATYLNNTGRSKDAIAFAKALIPNTTDAEVRANLFNLWGIGEQNIDAPPLDAMGHFKAAVKVKPDHWVAYNNIINTYLVFGDEEAALKAGEEMRVAAGGRPGRAPELYYQNVDLLTWNLQAWLAGLNADVTSNASGGTGSTSDGPIIADVQVRLHEPEAAELSLNLVKEDAFDPSIAAAAHFVRGRIAFDSGDIARAATEMEAFGTAYADPVISTNYAGFQCWIAPVEEAAGHPDKADAIFKTGAHYVDCYRFRADILDHRGDWAGAQKGYADAVALAPDLPAAYYSWGAALIRHGDLAGAVAKLKEASQRGPHWADPLKAWGDALLAQGHAREALEKYDQALQYAPAWSALKSARAAAAKPAA